MNSAGLPASPFRTDRFKGITEPWFQENEQLCVSNIFHFYSSWSWLEPFWTHSSQGSGPLPIDYCLNRPGIKSQFILGIFMTFSKSACEKFPLPDRGENNYYRIIVNILQWRISAGVTVCVQKLLQFHQRFLRQCETWGQDPVVYPRKVVQYIYWMKFQITFKVLKSSPV